MTARLVVAGTHSGVGKTTVATGLMAAFAARGNRVAGFKVGPDFIDPSYHALATGRPGRNLDAFLSGPELITPLFAHGLDGCDLAIIEGVMGLFDGATGGGELASTAQVAKLLRAPVVLVVDARAMSRSVAALVHGFATYEPEIHIAGVILNRVGSDAHERMLREALAPLGIPIVGVLRRHSEAAAPERHLGLIPAEERPRRARKQITALASMVAAACDLDALERVAIHAPPISAVPWNPSVGPPAATRVRVAVAAAPAFTFLYEENLELLRARGAEIVPFDPTNHESLPEGADALLIGGGFPETFAEDLSANESLRASVRGFASSGRPIVAECGGLLYLCRTLDGREMCGVIDARGRMTDRLTLGYRSAVASAASAVATPGTMVRGHEFHYSTVEPRAGASPAWTMGGNPEGFLSQGIHASYLHTHWAAFPQMAHRLVATALATRRGAVA